VHQAQLFDGLGTHKAKSCGSCISLPAPIVLLRLTNEDATAVLFPSFSYIFAWSSQ